MSFWEKVTERRNEQLKQFDNWLVNRVPRERMSKMGKCENCGNDREEYLNHYCKACLDEMIENNSEKEE